MGDNYIEFDTSPIEETCVQVSQTVDYMPDMRAEARRMMELLEGRFPDLKGHFAVKSASHDFGSYLEIRFYYEEDDDGEKEMQHVEANYPRTWADVEPVLLYKAA